MRGFSFDQACGLPVEEQPVDQVVGDVVVFVLGQIEGDVEVAQRGIFRTDGTRVWSDQIAYYLDRYGFAPELRRHFRPAPGAETSGHGSASQRGRPAGWCRPGARVP
ncbi:hypothetical protein ACFWRR_11300 [Streptomyces cellulosae]